jgi:glycerophosphoryl diester phosphodiesterase
LLSTYSAPGKIVISSSDHYVLLRLSQLLPQDSEIELALLADVVLLDLPAYAARLKTRLYHPCFGSLRQDIVDEAHAAGLQVNTWTLNERSQWAAAAKMGVDGVVTGDPEELMIFWGRAIPAGSASPIQV